MTDSGSIGAVSGLADQIGSLVGIGAASSSPDDVSITVNNQTIAGWQKIRVTRSLERIPNDFEIELTEFFPGQLSTITVAPGTPCELKIGGDLVITGYVDRYIIKLEDGSHNITITGRSKSQDLVDCSAIWEGGQISGTSAADVASKLAATYDIIIKVLQGNADMKSIPQFNLMYGETPAEIIDRITKFSALLYYDDTDGNLILSQVGEAAMASGFTEGVNVESSQATFSADQRYANYKVALLSISTAGDRGNSGFLREIAEDPGARANRTKIIICEAGGQGQQITQARGEWERNRRMGRAYQLDVVTDGWRDSDGTLWTPNRLVPVNMPTSKLVDKNYVIGEVTYILDENGTTARLTLMPPDAYSVEPILIQQQPEVEAGMLLNTPGGNQNPATPNLAPNAISPAVSPPSGVKPSTSSMNLNQAKSITDLFSPGN